MPISKQQFAQVLKSLPPEASDAQVAQATEAATQGTPLGKLWDFVNRPLGGSADALIPALRHTHGQEEGVVRRTAEDLGASLTSPISLGTAALGVGGAVAGAKGAFGVSKAARLAEAGLQAPFVAEGVHKMVEGDSTGEQLGGALEFGLGSMGVKSAMHGAFNPEQVTQSYMKSQGRAPAVTGASEFSPSRQMRIADAFSEMPHAPSDPKVASSYAALNGEVEKQYDFLVNKAGVKMEPWTQPGQPYAGSAEMVDDVRKNNHLFYFPSESGFGDGVIQDNPLLEKGANGLVYNDQLRAVHDYFGHARKGNQFGPKGEEAAYLDHRSMMPEDAHGALTTETRGQNSWVNFGPQMRNAEGDLLQKGEPGWLAPPDRAYADQKTGLLPEEFSRPLETSATGHTPAIASATDQSPRPSLGLSPELFEEVNQLHRTSGGSTTDIRNGQVVKDAKYLLSPYPERAQILDHAPTQQELQAYVEKHADLLGQEGHNLGTWDNEGKHYLDVSVRENDLTKALELGRTHKQKAIFDMVNGKEIPLEEAVQKTPSFINNEQGKKLNAPVTALSIAGPGAALTIDDSDPNDPNYALKHYGKLALNVLSLVGAGNTALAAAKRLKPLTLPKEAAARGAALMILGGSKEKWAQDIRAMGISSKDLPSVRLASEKIFATEAAKAADGLPKVKQLLKMVEAGRGDLEWYNTGEELKAYFGKDAPIVARLIAATSNNSTVKSNLTLAMKAYAQHKLDPTKPIEGLMKTLLPAVNLARAGEELNGRKVDNFAKALLGDPDAVVVDRWMMRAFGYKKDVPTMGQYDVIEHAVREIAKREKMEPRQVQAALWFGVKEVKEKGKGRPDSPPYGAIIKDTFGAVGDDQSRIENVLKNAVHAWKATPKTMKKGFGDAMRKVATASTNELPFSMMH